MLVSLEGRKRVRHPRIGARIGLRHDRNLSLTTCTVFFAAPLVAASLHAEPTRLSIYSFPKSLQSSSFITVRCHRGYRRRRFAGLEAAMIFTHPHVTS